MALGELEKSVLDEVEPQVGVYISELLKKIGILVNQPVKDESIEIKSGKFADFYKLNHQKFMLTKMSWDGKEGRLFFVYSMELAITLTGWMMGQPGPTIAEKAKTLAFDDELKEAFGEISNQMWGGINQLFIAKIDKDIHLSLDSTNELPEDGSKNAELIDELNYLFVKVMVKVADLEAFPLTFMISDNLASDVFGVALAGSAGGGFNMGAGLDKITAEQVMIPDYPSMEIKNTVGDAYDLMDEQKLAALALTEEGKVVRMVTKNNLEVIRSVFFDAPGQEERISRLMCIPLKEVNTGQKLVKVKLSDNLKDVVAALLKSNVQSLPVVNETDEFAGMITLHHLIKKMTQSEA